MASAPTLSLNKAIPGTQGAGSLIEVVETPWVFEMVDVDSVAVPISTRAQKDDLILVFGGFQAAGLAVGQIYNGWTDEFWLSGGSTFGAGTHPVQSFLTYHVVQDGEAGRFGTIGWSYSGAHPLTLLWTSITLRGVWLDAFFEWARNLVDEQGTASDNTLLQATTPPPAWWPGMLQVSSFAGCPNNNLPGQATNEGAVNVVSTAMNGPVFNVVAADALPTAESYPKWINWGTGSPLVTVPVAGTAVSVTLPPLPSPDPPLITLYPGGRQPGSVDAAAGFVVSWTTNLPQPRYGPQASWMLYAQHADDGSNGMFFAADTVSWSAPEYWNAGPDTTYAIPAGLFPNDGRLWDIYLAYTEANYGLRSVVGHITFTAADAPVVAVTGPYGNVATATPTISFATILAPGAGIRYWQVKVFSSDQYNADGFDPSTWTPRADSLLQTGGLPTESWTPPPLRGSAYYRAYVEVEDSFGGFSATTYSEWYAAYNTMATPSVTAVPDTDPSTGCPRAKITVTSTDDASLSGTTSVTVSRYDPVTHAAIPLRFGRDVPFPWPSQTVVVYDYDMPPNANPPIVYTAQSDSTYFPAFVWDDPVKGLFDNANDLFT